MQKKKEEGRGAVTAHMFSRDELAKATYPTDGDRLVCIFLRSCAAKRPSRCSRSQDSSWTRTLFSNVSRLLASYRVELFHFQLQDPAGSTQGCGLCYALSGSLGRPSWGTRAPVGLHLRPRLSRGDSSHLTTPLLLLLLLRPGHFSLSKPPFVLLHPPDLIPHPAASCRCEELSGKDHLPTTIPHSLGPPTHIHAPSFTKQPADTGPTKCTISLGTDSRCGRIGPVSHRRHATSLPQSLPSCLSLPFLSVPAGLSQQWPSGPHKRPVLAHPPVLLCPMVCVHARPGAVLQIPS